MRTKAPNTKIPSTEGGLAEGQTTCVHQETNEAELD